VVQASEQMPPHTPGAGTTPIDGHSKCGKLHASDDSKWAKYAGNFEGHIREKNCLFRVIARIDEFKGAWRVLRRWGDVRNAFARRLMNRKLCVEIFDTLILVFSQILYRM
jgi:hypothetical protein